MEMPQIGNKTASYHRRKSITKKKYGTMALILLFFILLTISFLLYTDFFDIEEININGNHHVSKKEILRNANLSVGINLFKFNKNKTEALIERHSLIKNAEITRKYPNKVNIRVLEREVTAIIPFEDGSFIYIDQEGVVLRKDSLLNTYNSPLITGLENISFIIGKPINIQPSWLADSLLEIILSLKNNKLIDRISEINVLEDNHIQIYTNDGSVIKIGDEKIMEKKMEFLKAFLSETHPKIIVDISHGGDPVYRPRAD